MKEKLEALIDALIQEDSEAAEEALHEAVTAKTRELLGLEEAADTDDEDEKDDDKDSDEKDDDKKEDKDEGESDEDESNEDEDEDDECEEEDK